MRILITDPIYDYKKFEDFGRIDYKPLISKKELEKIVGKYDVIICRTRTRIDKNVLKKAKKLKAIIVGSHSLNNIDDDYAIKRNIKIFNNGSSGRSVAEYVLNAILTFSRNLGKAGIQMKVGTYAKFQYLGFELLNRTVGVVGLGKVGREVYELMERVGAKVIGYDKKYHKTIQFKELLKESEIIVFCIPTKGMNKNFIGKKEFELMRKKPLLINISRSLIFDLKELEKVLKNGGIRGLVMDVYEDEVKRLKNIIGLKNVVATPHIASQTVECQKRISEYIYNVLKNIGR